MYTFTGPSLNEPPGMVRMSIEATGTCNDCKEENVSLSDLTFWVSGTGYRHKAGMCPALQVAHRAFAIEAEREELELIAA